MFRDSRFEPLNILCVNLDADICETIMAARLTFELSHYIVLEQKRKKEETEKET